MPSKNGWHVEFGKRIAQMTFHWELKQRRMLGYTAHDAFYGSAQIADDTYDLVMSEDRPAVLTRFRR